MDTTTGPAHADDFEKLNVQLAEADPADAPEVAQKIVDLLGADLDGSTAGGADSH